MVIRVQKNKTGNFFSKMLAVLKKVVLLPRNSQAEIAQLVEHDLAKVGVASSSLVFRSKHFQAEFLEQRAQKQTKFDFAESRTRKLLCEAKRK